jgi:hypothetical protein
VLSHLLKILISWSKPSLPPLRDSRESSQKLEASFEKPIDGQSKTSTCHRNWKRSTEPWGFPGGSSFSVVLKLPEMW